MAKHSKVWAGLMLACSLSLPALAQDDAVTADTIVATVNGTDITLGELIILREKLPAQYQALPDDLLFKGLIDQAVQQTALEQAASAETTKRDELWMKTDRRSYLAGKALQAVVEAAVTDAALQAAYDEKYANAPSAKEYSAQHILVDSEEKANALKAEIDGGADFGEVAKANSTDTGSAVNGGDLGWFGVGMMVKPFEDAVVAATPGTVVGPVQSDFGFHLIKVNEVRDAAKPSIDEVRDELAAQIEQTAVEAKLAELTAAAEISRPGEGLDPALIRDATLLDK
jgi:peptidyl-prolyl cis-trans isomerase C